MATGEPADRPDLLVDIDTIMRLMDYDAMRELERAADDRCARGKVWLGRRAGGGGRNGVSRRTLIPFAPGNGQTCLSSELF